MKAIENGKSLTRIRMKNKLLPISAIIAILCLTSMFVIWASAQSNTLYLEIDATGDFQRKGNCFLSSSGTIEVELPPTYTYRDTKKIGNVNSTASYSYEDLSSLTLVEEIMVHIHVDGSFRRLDQGSVPITLMEIRGCSSVSAEGVQYCVYVYAGNVGSVTKTESSIEVYAMIPAPELGAQSLCVRQWSEGTVVDEFCIPLYGFEVVVTGTLAM